MWPTHQCNDGIVRLEFFLIYFEKLLLIFFFFFFFFSFFIIILRIFFPSRFGTSGSMIRLSVPEIHCTQKNVTDRGGIGYSRKWIRNRLQSVLISSFCKYINQQTTLSWLNWPFKIGLSQYISAIDFLTKSFFSPRISYYGCTNVWKRITAINVLRLGSFRIENRSF